MTLIHNLLLAAAGVPTETPEEITNVTSATSSADATSYTFSSVALGAAAANRAIYVFMTGQESTGAAPTITPVTVGGVSATKISDVNNSTEPQYPGSLWKANVPSGTTGDISITLNKTMSQFGIIAWALTGDHYQFNLQTDGSTSTASFSLTSVPDNSVILAGRGGLASHTHTWSSAVDENIDQVIADGVVMSGASKEHATGGNFTVTCTPNSTDSRPRTFCLVLSPTQ